MCLMIGVRACDAAPVMHLHFHAEFHLHVLPLSHITPFRHSADDDALFSAVCGGHLEIVRLLIGAGADVNMEHYDSWNNEEISPLHVAVDNEDFEMIHLLLGAGADITAYDR